MKEGYKQKWVGHLPLFQLSGSLLMDIKTPKASLSDYKLGNF